MSDQVQPEDITAIEEALLDGQKIQAIKIYREASGADLMQAKEFIETLSSKLIEQDPEKYGKIIPKATGCTTVFLLGASITLATVVWSIHHLG